MDMNAAAIWINNTFAAFDQSMAVLVHKLYDIGGGFFTPFFEIISELGHGGIPLIILSLILMLFSRTSAWHGFTTADCRATSAMSWRRSTCPTAPAVSLLSV